MGSALQGSGVWAPVVLGRPLILGLAKVVLFWFSYFSLRLRQDLRNLKFTVSTVFRCTAVWP